MKKYRTVSAGGIYEASYEINRSKFIAHVKRAEDEERAREFLQSMKKNYFDATHNCSAWVIGVDVEKHKSNDDGEPGGTAGNPILEVIKKNALTDTIIVVTRYFGGIKLGAGGLIRAYSHAAAMGLSAAELVTMTPMTQLAVTIEYGMLASVENWLRQKKITVVGTEYAADVTLNLMIEPSNIDWIISELTELTAANFLHELGEETLVPIKII
ncbi:MAG: YigZ family protein [Selenomonadaceae bacterium]|nr:YigZ family protein [Selenomonadaceae bacterium]